MENSHKMEQVKKRGVCVLCGNRVMENQAYVTAKEGYCHTGCIKGHAAFN